MVMFIVHLLMLPGRESRAAAEVVPSSSILGKHSMSTATGRVFFSGGFSFNTVVIKTMLEFY